MLFVLNGINYNILLSFLLALPFLGNTQVFLWYPIVGIGFLFLFSTVLLLLGLRINLTRIVMAFHYG